MIRQVAAFIGRTLLLKVMSSRGGEANSGSSASFFDIRFGMRLMRDRRVPVSSKFQALFLGAVFAGILQVVEVPLESVLLLVMPLVGLAGVAFDGIEVVAASILGASLVLPVLAPKELVNKARKEGDGRVYQTVDAKIR